jgi:hypothetical protein
MRGKTAINGHRKSLMPKRVDFTKLKSIDFKLLVLAYVSKRTGGALANKVDLTEGQVRYRLQKAKVSLRSLRDGTDPICEKINAILINNPTIDALVVRHCKNEGVYEAAD